MQITTKQLEEEREEADQHDEWIVPRVEFMYNYLDFKNDRHRVRERFIKQMNKKTTIEDIAGLLDKYTLDSKANAADHFDPVKHILEQPEAAKRDFSQNDFNWHHSIISAFDPIKPQWLDDQT